MPMAAPRGATQPASLLGKGLLLLPGLTRGLCRAQHRCSREGPTWRLPSCSLSEERLPRRAARGPGRGGRGGEPGKRQPAGSSP